MEKNIEIELSLLFKSYLEIYVKILKKYQYTKIDEEGENIRKNIFSFIKKHNLVYSLVDLSTVILYYGTKLTLNEILKIKKEDLIFEKGKKVRIKKTDDENTILFDEECSFWIEELNKFQNKSEGKLLEYKEHSINPEKVCNLIKKYPNQDVLDKLSSCFTIYTESDYEVIPTPLRLSTDLKYTGKGVTIAFIDSGFYPHPDITKPINRVLKYVNIPEPEKNDFAISKAESWHGMQTSLSSAGNGYLSGGLYRGIASDANLVLLKVTGPNGSIDTEDIIKGIEWCVRNKEEYNIKILNISLGDDQASSYLENALDQAAEGAVQAGITVLVAVGNDGDSHNIIAPPASAPSVITVCVLDDKNDLDVNSYTMYRSSYGKTLDGLMKPEIIAPGIWVAAPILPDTPFFEQAVLLSELIEEVDEKVFFEKLKQNIEKLNFKEAILSKNIDEAKQILKNKVKSHKIVGKYYQHVDGTSFSAPIVASVIAQMLEANPNLNPRRIKQLLTQTTDKLFNVPKERQGYGLIHARKAVKESLNDIHRIGYNRPMSPYVKGESVTFYYVDSQAKSVSVAGDFNGWNTTRDLLTKENRSLWKLEKKISSGGSYRYKFVIDGKKWLIDKENENKEPDGFGYFNNRLNIL